MISLDYGQDDGSEVDGIRMYKAQRPGRRNPGPALRAPADDEDVARDEARERGHLLPAHLVGHHRAHGRVLPLPRQAVDLRRARPTWTFQPGQEEIILTRDKYIFRWGLRRVDEIVAQHPAQQINIRRNYGREGTLIPSTYVPPAGAATTARATPCGSRDGESKRPELLVEIARRMPGIRVVMVGGPESGARERRYIGRARSGEKRAEPGARGLRPVPEIDRWFDGARVLINTSKFEGFPNTFLQRGHAGSRRYRCWIPGRSRTACRSPRLRRASRTARRLRGAS
jgi:hypothetical protein